MILDDAGVVDTKPETNDTEKQTNPKLEGIVLKIEVNGMKLGENLIDIEEFRHRRKLFMLELENIILKAIKKGDL